MICNSVYVVCNYTHLPITTSIKLYCDYSQVTILRPSIIKLLLLLVVLYCCCCCCCWYECYY